MPPHGSALRGIFCQGIMKYKVNSQEITDEVKQAADGAFVDLPCGFTHYKIEGETGEWCVLTHGYATPLYIYDEVAAALVAAGYRVLRYDLLGRGLSERVEADYTPALLGAQLAQLVDALIPDERFYLFGTSMGGTVTTTYVAAHPERVKKLVLYAPAGMVFDAPAYMKLCRCKGVGDLLFATLGAGILTKGCASELAHRSPEVVAAYRDKFAYYTQFKGMMRCVLSSLRHTILNFDEDLKGYVGTAASGVPVLVVWGTEDKTMPYYQAATMQKVMPAMRLVTFESSGHVFLYDEPERTMAVTLPFLAE